MKKNFLLPTIYFLLSTILGCGYSSRGFINPQYKTILVKPVVNRVRFTGETQEYRSFRSIPPLIEDSFTKKLISLFNLEGNLRVVKEGADLVVETEITDFLRESLRYTQEDKVKEYRLKLYFSYKLYDRDNNFLREANLVADTTYALEGKASKSEEEALSELVEDACRRIVEDIVEEW